MAPEKLQSLIPIIVVIAVSWFLSYLGAKAKKQGPDPRQDGKPVSDTASPGPRLSGTMIRGSGHTWPGAVGAARPAPQTVSSTGQEENVLEQKLLEFFGITEDVERERQARRDASQPVNTALPGRRQNVPPAPGPAPKPIEPKWWGA